MIDRNDIRKYKGWTFTGWTNDETKAVSYWLLNFDYPGESWAVISLDYFQTEGSNAKYLLADQLKDTVTGNAPKLGTSPYSYLLRFALDKVNWIEIAEAMLDQHQPF